LLPLITFAPTDCPSHHSLIPIQRSKNENLKTKIPWRERERRKRDERETERERRKKEERRETKEIKIEN
jgi:hypothetical protein